MKERPIPFRGPMVRAILEGRKTQTRRTMSPQPPNGWFVESPNETWEPSDGASTPRWLVDRCPFGSPGERLWVKETIRRVALVGLGCAWFAADDEPTVINTWPWKRDVLPAIFTPRMVSRITLEVTEVRVQRLQEISEGDAHAEGVRVPDAATAKQDTVDTHGMTPYRAAFACLWDSINGKRAPWASTPWVWAITFGRVL